MKEYDSARILLVEDDPAVRGFTAALLSQHGYYVVEAANGNQGLEWFQQHRGEIDAILTDVVMPGMGGPEMVRRIFRIDPAVRVVLMSGFTSNEELPTRTDPTIPFLQKPFSTGTLVQAINDALAA